MDEVGEDLDHAKVPQATVVMSHDDDWWDIFGEGNPVQTMSDLLQRLGDEYVIVEKGALSASSGNEPPELFGGSGSRTTSSTTHASLPALNHSNLGGLTLNPLHHPAHDILSTHREREQEGSPATMRRWSRSLDDQVNVLTPGDNNNNNAHVANALSMMISVPESDEYGRSLSARALAQRESPTSINTPSWGGEEYERQSTGVGRAPAAETNFSATCTGISFNSSNDNLTATCQKSGGVGTETTTIGLNSCVGNTNGELVAGATFSGSCSSISFSGVRLSATCKTPNGTTIRNSIDLNGVFSNNNGVLTCP
ncbi:Cyanovirin-N [Mycena capillaripes]|nr:Cyanovirin-N [Mycena capillaripes]